MGYSKVPNKRIYTTNPFLRIYSYLVSKRSDFKTSCLFAYLKIVRLFGTLEYSAKRAKRTDHYERKRGRKNSIKVEQKKMISIVFSVHFSIMMHQFRNSINGLRNWVSIKYHDFKRSKVIENYLFWKKSLENGQKILHRSENGTISKVQVITKIRRVFFSVPRCSF